MNRNIDLNNMSTDEIKEWLINIKEKYYYEIGENKNARGVNLWLVLYFSSSST